MSAHQSSLSLAGFHNFHQLTDVQSEGDLESAYALALCNGTNKVDDIIKWIGQRKKRCPALEALEQPSAPRARRPKPVRPNKKR